MPRSSVLVKCAVWLVAVEMLGALCLANAFAYRPADAICSDQGPILNRFNKVAGATLQFAEEVANKLSSLAQLVDRPEQPTDPASSMLLRVVDPDGKPVRGVIVVPWQVTRDEAYVHSESGGSVGRGWVPTFTGTDGTVRIARPAKNDQGMRVEVNAEGYVSSAVSWNEEAKMGEPVPPEFTLKLDRGSIIGGVVQNQSGQPVASASVVLSLPDDGGDRRVRPSIHEHEELTDSQGRWQCSHLPSRLDGLTVVVSHNEHVKLDLDVAVVAAQLPQLKSREAVSVMQRGLVVEVAVTDVKGNPVPSAQVELFPTSFTPGVPAATRAQASTDERGRYRFTNCAPGDNTVFVAARGLTTQRRDITVAPGMAPIHFRLTPGPALKIRVVDREGKPVPGARIITGGFLLFANHPYLADTMETDHAGRWATSNSPEGEMPLEVSKCGYATAHPKFFAREKEYVVTLRPPVRITGRVLDAATKQPVRSVYVSADYEHMDRAPSGMGFPLPAVNGEGGYQLTFDDMLGAEQVTYRLRVQSPGYVTQRSKEFRAGEGPPSLDIELVRGKAVEGVVKRPDGTPVADAKVFVSTVSEPWRVADGRVDEPVSPPHVCEQSGADGRFRLPMPLEPYGVGAVHDFGGAEIAASELDARGEIVLRPWGRVEGTAHARRKTDQREPDVEESVDLNVNRPPDDGKCDKQPRIDWSYSARLDGSRCFAFDRVLPGRVEVELSDGSFEVVDGEIVDYWRPQTVEISPGQTVHVEFARKGGPVVGRVVPPSGTKKTAATAGLGALVFQTPLVPVPAEIAAKPAEARKAWENQWLASEAGQAAGRAAQHVSFLVGSDNVFHADDVVPGVYKLVVELHATTPGAQPRDWAEKIAWLAEEVVVPATGTKPCNLENRTLKPVTLFKGDVAPDFAFKTEDGQMHWLSEYRGRRVFLNLTEHWDRLDENADANSAKEQLLRWGGGGPLVWINLSSDPDCPSVVKVTQDAQFQYLQGRLQSIPEFQKAYDIRSGRKGVEILVGADGKVAR